MKCVWPGGQSENLNPNLVWPLPLLLMPLELLLSSCSKGSSHLSPAEVGFTRRGRTSQPKETLARDGSQHPTGQHLAAEPRALPSLKPRGAAANSQAPPLFAEGLQPPEQSQRQLPLGTPAAATYR